MGQSERNRIFLKVKEKIDAERQEKAVAADVAKVQADKDEILKKQNFLRDQEAEKRAQAMNVLLEELNQKRQVRAKQVLNELEQRGVEKVGKNKIESLMKQEEVDCDQIESFYQKELEKDRAAFEVQQRQKRNEVELMAHSTKCEEKKALLAYCEKHGEKAVAEIK